MKEKLTKLLDDRRFYMVISVVIALLYWLLLSLSDDSNIEKTIYNVPVQLDYNSSVYMGFGLDLIAAEETTVDVTVVGPRSQVSDLSSDDFLVYPNVNSVTTAGIKELRLLCSTVNTTAQYSIARLSKETVSLRFDKIVTQSFPIQVDDSDIHLADGFLMDACYATPAEISITGPAEELASIDRVVARLPGLVKVNALKESTLTRGTVTLLDAAGQPVDRTLLNVAQESVEVSIPVLRRTTLNLKVNFLNVPQGFNVESLGCVLDHATIDVAVPTSFNGDLDLVVGHIDMGADNYDCRKAQSFALQLPDGYTNLSNVDIVTASFDTQDYVSKIVNVSDIRVVNVPQGKKITSRTETIYNVELLGPADRIAMLDTLEDEGLLDEYIIAQVDGSKVGINRGQQTIAVQILLPSTGDVLAVGEYAVVINVE